MFSIRCLRVLPNVMRCSQLQNMQNIRFYCAIVQGSAEKRRIQILNNNYKIQFQSRSFTSSIKSMEKTKEVSNDSKSSEGALQKSILEEVLIHEKRKPTTFTGKVVEKASNTFMYTAVLAGIGLIGAFVYVLAGEFFAQDSPQTIFNRALDLIRDDGRCQDIFGATIAGFGEETARGRRRHVAHHKYEKDGRQRIRVLFHVKGDRDEGIAQAEMEQRNGDWEWRFLYVENKRRPKVTHILIDNR